MSKRRVIPGGGNMVIMESFPKRELRDIVSAWPDTAFGDSVEWCVRAIVWLHHRGYEEEAIRAINEHGEDRDRHKEGHGLIDYLDRALSSCAMNEDMANAAMSPPVDAAPRPR